MCQKIASFSEIDAPSADIDSVFSNRVLCTRLHPHRLRHCRAFVFFGLWGKNTSHPLRGWSVIPDGIKIWVMLCLLAWFLIMQWKLLRSEIIT